MRTLALIALLLAAPLEDRTAWRETDWSGHLAAEVGGVAEYRLPDGRRVDILTDTTAWEVEWCDKWPESIGQSLGYAIATDRTPGVWLLKRGAADDEKYNQCLGVIAWLRGRGMRIEFRVQEVPR